MKHQASIEKGIEIFIKDPTHPPSPLKGLPHLNHPLLQIKRQLDKWKLSFDLLTKKEKELIRKAHSCFKLTYGN